MPSRRDVLRLCGSIAFLAGTGSRLRTFGQESNPSDLTTETQRGDPEAPKEYLTFSPSSIENLVIKPGKASFEKWDPTISLSMISVARQFIGYSRTRNPVQISEFLALFNLPLKDKSGDVPFCASAISYCALMAYCSALSIVTSEATRTQQLRLLMPDLEHYCFYPTASCVDMYHIAAGKRRWVAHKPNSNTVPRSGWIVLYDWDKRGLPDHCGMVESASKQSISTVEFNTSAGKGNQRIGGAVAAPTRTYEHVLGFIVTDKKA